jgi:hypothetical protein
MLKIRGMSIVGNFLTGAARFGHGRIVKAMATPLAGADVKRGVGFKLREIIANKGG